MINWHSTAIKLLEQNPSISNLSLAKLIGCKSITVVRAKKRWNINNGKTNRDLSSGVRYLRFNADWMIWEIVVTIGGARQLVGCSSNFNRAIGILDAFLYARERKWI